LLHLLGGIYLGWSLGANDAANVFGTAVTSKMISFLMAALICAGFVVLGATLEGQAGIETISNLSTQSIYSATITAVGAAVSITVMTFLRIPSSTSQAVVGAIIGVGMFGSQVEFTGLGKIVLCWVGTPIGGLIIAIILYKTLGYLLNRWQPSIYSQDTVLRFGLIAAGAYGAYALGANNVANVTGVYVGAGLLDVQSAVLIGGLSIGFGVITYSKPVMATVGKSIVRLDAFSAFIVVFGFDIPGRGRSGHRRRTDQTSYGSQRFGGSSYFSRLACYAPFRGPCDRGHLLCDPSDVRAVANNITCLELFPFSIIV